jgi:hypothetical protein
LRFQEPFFITLGGPQAWPQAHRLQASLDLPD